jgi:tetratricopeptide (TPR) repeat protein
MSLVRSFATGAAAVVVVLAGCASTPKTQSGPHPEDAGTQTVVAEIALERGDCRAASDSYAVAASSGTTALARRASEVGLACQNLPAAWQSVEHWRAKAPEDLNAAVAYATVALKLYKIPEARGALTPVFKTADPDAQKDLVALIELLTQEADATATFAALDDAVASTAPAPSQPVLVALGDLALRAYDFSRAEHHARDALTRDARSVTALRVLARVSILRGDAPSAIAAAREVMRIDDQNGTFELADVLTELDRLEEARQELERLRAAGAGGDEVDRRLALIAFQSGDLKEARRRFADLIDRGEASDAALFYLADIASRTGDKEAALAAYRQLADSSMAVEARTRAAGLLLDRSERRAAFELLDTYATAHPESTFDLTLAKAHLLADHGDAEGGSTLLGAALERYPHHPTLEYERATLLERAGHVRESVQAFERLLTERPDDPTLQNALGYTLADHGLELSRAETLIRRALTVTPDSPAVLDSLGWVRLRRGDVHGAVPMLERAYTIGRDSEIAAHWGEALWVSGAQTQARKVWAAALAHEPDSDVLKATVHRLLPQEHP